MSIFLQYASNLSRFYRLSQYFFKRNLFVNCVVLLDVEGCVVGNRIDPQLFLEKFSFHIWTQKIQTGYFSSFSNFSVLSHPVQLKFIYLLQVIRKVRQRERMTNYDQSDAQATTPLIQVLSESFESCLSVSTGDHFLTFFQKLTLQDNPAKVVTRD